MAQPPAILKVLSDRVIVISTPEQRALWLLDAEKVHEDIPPDRGVSDAP